MNKRSEKNSLTNLYQSHSVRDLIWRTLCTEFEHQFEALMLQGEVSRLCSS